MIPYPKKLKLHTDVRASWYHVVQQQTSLHYGLFIKLHKTNKIQWTTDQRKINFTNDLFTVTEELAEICMNNITMVYISLHLFVILFTFCWKMLLKNKRLNRDLLLTWNNLYSYDCLLFQHCLLFYFNII